MGNTYNLGDGEADYNADRVGKNKTEVVVPPKHLRHFWRTLNILLLNCETELILTWSKNCALAEMTMRASTSNYYTHWIIISNNRCKILYSSCYFVNRKLQETFRTIKIRI